MTALTKFLRFLCLCMVIQKGSWTPKHNANNATIVKRSIKHAKNKEKSAEKPEWLKQWTISKGWMHNRSHLLELGVKNESNEDLLAIATPTTSKRVWETKTDNDSSISIDDLDELLSLESNIEAQSKSDDLDKIEVISDTPDDINSNETIRLSTRQDMSVVFKEVSMNYRRNFPDKFVKNLSSDLELPEIYKERILLSKNDNSNLLTEFWSHLRPKKKSKSLNHCKFTVNSLYDNSEVSFKKIEVAEDNLDIEYKKEFFQAATSSSRSTLGQNIALYNTLNSKTNLIDETIYECSEDSASLYQNPLYSPLETKNKQFYDFHTNHMCKPDSFIRRRYRLARVKGSKFDSVKYKTKTEKYIIRHIKVRIMLSLRVGRFKRFRKKENQAGVGNKCCERLTDDFDTMRMKIVRTHEEQRRIGNGRTSIKIQNMR